MKTIASVILIAAYATNAMAAEPADSTLHKINEVVVTGTRYKTDVRHMPVTI